VLEHLYVIISLDSTGPEGGEPADGEAVLNALDIT
jgi:hypothetical protein